MRFFEFVDYSIGKIDNYLLFVAQKISNKLQDWFNITCFQVARKLWYLHIASHLIIIYATFKMVGYSFWFFFSIFVAVGLSFLARVIVYKVSDETYTFGYRNPREEKWIFLRRVFISYILGIILALITLVINEIFALPEIAPAIHYMRLIDQGSFCLFFTVLWILLFQSCTPRPPKPKKQRERKTIISFFSKPSLN